MGFPKCVFAPAFALSAACASLVGCGGARSPAGSVTLQVALKGTHYHLDNGLEVVLHEDHSTNYVAVNIRYHVGSKDDPAGRSGFAHLYEHLMFLGARHVGDEGFATALEKVSAREFNAWTSEDSTEYHEIVPSRQLPATLWLEADRMAYPLERLQQDNFDRERQVVKNEWRQRCDNVPFGHVDGIVHEAMFPLDHPYHDVTIGSPADLDRATLEEARAFGAAYYTPSNATLVIAGDFDTKQAQELITSYFGKIPAGNKPAPKSVAFTKLAKDVRVLVEAEVEAPRVVVAWPVPPPHVRGYDELVISAGYIAGMTNRKLRSESKLARGVSHRIDSARLGSVLSFTVDLEPDADPEAAVSAIETRVRWMTTDQQWDDFADRRTARMTSLVLGLMNLDDRASQMQEYLDVYGDQDVAQAELRRVQDLHIPNMVAATKEFLRDAGKVVVVVRPKRGAPPSGRIKQ